MEELPRKIHPSIHVWVQAHLANLEGTGQRMMAVPERLRICGRGVWQWECIPHRMGGWEGSVIPDTSWGGHLNSSCPSTSGRKGESCHAELSHTWGPPSLLWGPLDVQLDGALPLVTLPGPRSSTLRLSLSRLFQPGPVSGSALMQVPQLSRGLRCQPQQMTTKIALQEQ